MSGRPRPILSLLALLALLLPAAITRADSELMVPAGALPRLETQVEGKTLALPLEHTDVTIEVSGFVARAKVSQRFGNPHAQPIEAVYVFPLPERAAVDDFQMQIGERIIEGKIEKRAEARRIYETARRAGHTAALLEQERPNIFTQSVANLAPGETIVVTLHFVQTLPYDAGAFELAFPMVVGPRFMPGEPATVLPGDGTHVDTMEVPDASRISPPVLPAGMRSGHDISLSVKLDAGLPIRDFEVPSHDVRVQAEGDAGLALSLAEQDSVPNRDFVMRWWVDDASVQAGLLTHTDSRGKFFSLMIQPPKLDVDALVGKRELVFVVDVSGSMSGLPLWICKKAMRDALSRVRPGDTFNVLTFAGRPGRLWEAARPATEANIERASRYVDGMGAGGGTHMRDAVAAALEGEVEAGRHRYVFFLTDGYVGNEQQIIASARQYVSAHDTVGRRARVFTLGVGSSVNRMLIEGLAKGGKGTAFVATNREDPARAVDAFFRRIDHPVLVDLSLDFGSLPVREQSVYPRRLPDLFASRPLIIQGRYDGSARGVITLRAKTEDGRKIRMPITIDLPRHDAAHEALPSLWAREKIQALDDSVWDDGRGMQPRKLEDIRTAITRLGIDYRILTAYTSFVAVDRSRVIGDGDPAKVVQPVEVPEDVDGRAAGAVARTPAAHTQLAQKEGKKSAADREALREQVIQQGLLSSLPGPDDGAVLGGLTGSSIGDVGGAGGLGLGGLGTRGAGKASTTSFGATSGTKGRGRGGYGAVGLGYGIGGLSTSGVGAGGGGRGSAVSGGSLSGTALGTGGLGHGRHLRGTQRSAIPEVSAASVSVQGSLDKSVIQRIIRRHQNEIRYCYERELQRDPTLYGKVVTTFTIEATGAVSGARIASSTLQNQRVEQCIAGRVVRWRFPQPMGGGKVAVSYPWLLRPPSSPPAPSGAARSNVGGALKVEGALDRPSVLGFLHGKIGGFQRCYERALTRARPTLKGKVVLGFTIEADGSVSGAKLVSDTLKDPPTTSCLLGVLSKLRFPSVPGDGSSQVEVPMIFLPGN